MPKPQGFCIFCGGPCLSKEDVWPIWLNDYIPKRLEQCFIHSLSLDPLDPIRIVERRTGMKQGDMGGQPPRVVCKNCNGGWMSRLQKSAKPLLAPIITGGTTVIEEPAQHVIARWATMTAMTLEFYFKPLVGVSQEQRRSFKEKQQPPEGRQIWLGRFQSQRLTRWCEHNAFTLTLKSTPSDAGNASGCNSQISTIVMGELYLHVFSSTMEDLVPMTIPGEVGRRLVQLWPLPGVPISWPPSASILDEEERVVANKIYIDLVGMIRGSSH
jgi:hypothetical protein